MSFFKNASILFLLHSPPYIYKGKDNNKSVNIFRKNSYHITLSVSTYYKTYCFAFQKRRFCTVKAALLHRKTYAFAMPKRNYRFSTKLSLQNKGKIPSTLSLKYLVYFLVVFVGRNAIELLEIEANA